jgi:hypothetical protein
MGDKNALDKELWLALQHGGSIEARKWVHNVE